MKISNIWQGVVVYSELLLPLSPYSVKIKGQSESFSPASLANGWQTCLVGLTSSSRAVLPSQGFSFFFFSVTASGTSRLPTCRRGEAGQREGGAQSQAAWWDIGETWITPTSSFFFFAPTGSRTSNHLRLLKPHGLKTNPWSLYSNSVADQKPPMECLFVLKF